MHVDLAAATQLLERTPQAMRALLAGLSSAWTDANEGPDTWSPRMIIAHLIHAERDNWLPRARVFLRDDAPQPFPAFDQAAPMDGFAGVAIEDMLDEFLRLRTTSLASLTSWRLDDADLAATAVHPRFGEVMFGQLLAAWVAHDLAHLAQISRVMAKQYRDAVGPWRAFLPILDR